MTGKEPSAKEGTSEVATPRRDPDIDREHDLELIRSSIELTAEERLAVLQAFVDTFWTPRHG